MSVPQYNGVDVPVITVQPNWSDSVTVSTVYRTAIVEALDTTEERHQKNPRALYTIEFKTLNLSIREQGYLRKQFDLSAAMPIGVPLWSEKVELAEAVVADDLVLTTTEMSSAYRAFGHVMLWSDYLTWEIVEVEFAPFTTVIGLLEGVVNDWPAGTVVVPMMFGQCVRPEFQQVTDVTARVEIKFAEKWLGLSRQGIRDSLPPIPPGVETFDTVCRDIYRVHWGDLGTYAKGFRVEIASSHSGPWYPYIEIDDDGTPEEIAIGNYFGGIRYLRYSVAIEYEYNVGDIRTYFAPFKITHPTAPVLAPPVFGSFTNSSASAHSFGATSKSGVDLALCYVMSERENDLLGLDDVYLEVHRRLEVLDNGSYPGSIPTWTHVDGAATIKCTGNNTVPSLVNGTANGLELLPSVQGESFGLVMRAKAFKSGCGSAQVLILIDKRQPWGVQFQGNGQSATTTGPITIQTNYINSFCALVNASSDFPVFSRYAFTAVNTFIPINGVDQYLFSISRFTMDDLTLDLVDPVAPTAPPGYTNAYCIVDADAEEYLEGGLGFTGPSGTTAAIKTGFLTFFSAFIEPCGTIHSHQYNEFHLLFTLHNDFP